METETDVGLFAGVDWGGSDHVVVIVDDQGRRVDSFRVADSNPGIKFLVAQLQGLGVGLVAIERSDGPLVEALQAAGFTVFVIPPGQVRGLRSRYGSAGNKDDRFDAFVLADVLRTDRLRLTPFTPSRPETLALRSLVRARKELVGQRVAIANQLRAHLLVAFPGGTALFVRIDSQANLAFLSRFTTQDDADWLSVKRLDRWVRGIGYAGRVSPEKLFERLQGAPRGIRGPAAVTYAVTTLALVAVLKVMQEQLAAVTKQIEEHLVSHPDGHIFMSFPRAGKVRAARLLVEIGDARGRFPTASSLASLAGVTPSTRQSGKVKVVAFRRGANTKLRDALCDFAGDTRKCNPWAADMYDRARGRGHTHQHAVRILARAWTQIIWRCWQDGVPYDQHQHGAMREHELRVKAA